MLLAARISVDESLRRSRSTEGAGVLVLEINFGDEDLRVHWWSPRLLEASTARFVALVEGDADRVIGESVAVNLGIDLDRLGAVVVELDGADKFRNVFPLLGPDGLCRRPRTTTDDPRS